MRIKQSILICFGIALVLMTVGTASAGTFTVNNSTGPVADYTSIQDAVNNATDGDTISVFNGTYTENVDVSQANITIESEFGADFTIVQAADSNDHVFHVTADNVTISGFYVTGATESLKAGIHLDGDDENSIINNIISNNKISNNWWGIFLHESRNNMLINNTVNSNNRWGICLGEFSNDNTLNNNIANWNNGAGILISMAYHNTLTNNTVNWNNGTGILLTVESGNNKLISNTANANNGTGILLSDSCLHNDLINNTANSNNGTGISLFSWSQSNTLINNTANWNNGAGIYVGHVSNTNTLINNTASNNYGDGIYVDIMDIGLTKLINNTANSNNWTGIRLGDYTSDNILINNTANSNRCGIKLDYSNNNNLTSNTASNNTENGIYLKDSSNNTIYNNHFNNTNNTLISADSTGNIWNITKTAGTNIIGGPYLGGNYWSHPDGTGFSQMNEDTDSDGFCDSPLSEYELDVNNIDYLPLYLAPLTPTEKVENLRDYISGLEGVDDGTKASLNAKLDNALHHLEKGEKDKAIEKLENFIKFVGIKERQGKLGTEQAEYLINEANNIIDIIQNLEG